MPGKHLLLLRHAKSSWSDPRLDDHDRPLNARGRRAASVIGRYLQREGIRPDLVLCSSAARTRETLDRLDLGPGTEVLVEDTLYGADGTALIDRVRRVDDAVGSVLLIGHNPGIEDAALTLTGHASELAEKFPTGALASLSLAVDSWQDLGPGDARLLAFVLPRHLGEAAAE